MLSEKRRHPENLGCVCAHTIASTIASRSFGRNSSSTLDECQNGIGANGELLSRLDFGFFGR